MASNYNILLCSYCIDQNDVGEAKMAYEWIRALSKHVRICVVTTGSRLHHECGLENCTNIDLVTIRPRINWKRFDAFDRAVHPGYIEYFIRSRKIIKTLSRNHHFDLGHHLSPFSLRYPSPLIATDLPYVAGPISGGQKTPSVIKELDEKESPLAKCRIVDELRMKSDPFLIRHYQQAARLVITAQYVGQLLPPKYMNKTHVIPAIALDENDISGTRTPSPGHIVKIITAARLVPSKGIELLILALATCKQLSRIRLDLYGCGSQEGKYRELAHRLGLGDHVYWKGFVPNEEVLQAYGQADIFALPSLKEPAGISVIEAMAAGLPVICVDTGGPAYSVDSRCGIKIPMATKAIMVNDLARAIDDLVENPLKRIEMGRHGQNRVRENLTWKVVAKKMLTVYESAIHAPSDQ